MRKMRLGDLDGKDRLHFLEGVIPGRYLAQGGLSFKKPGFRTHPAGCACQHCDGQGRHVHADYEVFIILQGKARMEVDGIAHPLATGDVIICEPGEDHHLISDENEPCVNLWLHAGDKRHPDQDSA